MTDGVHEHESCGVAVMAYVRRVLSLRSSTSQAVTGGAFAETVARGERPAGCFAALCDEVAAVQPTIVVIEDLHWADEATLDVVTMLGRRAEIVPALVVATYRDDELAADHPLRSVLGELRAGSGVRRLALAPLSLGAVEALTAAAGVDAAGLYRVTAGNPFFVTEVLAAGGADIPATVRDAVLARAARLSGHARRLLEAAAVVPGRVDLWLLEALASRADRPPGGVPGFGGPDARATRMSLSGTSSRASRSRSRSRQTAGSRFTVRACGTRGARKRESRLRAARRPRRGGRRRRGRAPLGA